MYAPPLAPAACCCRRGLDALGDHVAACQRSGVLRSRGRPFERAAARVCCQAGATVQQHVLLQDLNVEPERLDERRIEVIANGLPFWNGTQVAVDTTLVAQLTSAGAPRRIRGRNAGAALQVARRAKERAYPEFAASRRCHLTVLGIEVGGRCSSEASMFVRQLACCRARAVPASSRAACTSARALR